MCFVFHTCTLVPVFPDLVFLSVVNFQRTIFHKWRHVLENERTHAKWAGGTRKVAKKRWTTSRPAKVDHQLRFWATPHGEYMLPVCTVAFVLTTFLKRCLWWPFAICLFVIYITSTLKAPRRIWTTSWSMAPFLSTTALTLSENNIEGFLWLRNYERCSEEETWNRKANTLGKTVHMKIERKLERVFCIVLPFSLHCWGGCPPPSPPEPFPVFWMSPERH